ncbi:hypothetical protein GCM10010234_50180 [Streptomyces hawaiiensis]|uniref:DUF6896 domain-containing protein n=1 Tax=Streptomyces hawaiiensis TaxID=67305 RepID=UPI0031CF41A9
MRNSDRGSDAARRSASARETVVGFIRSLGAADAALRQAVPSLERLADLLAKARSGEISRKGEAGGYAYAVHGFGCLLTSPDGIDIDVDFTADGREIFDLWRLGRYARSLPSATVPSAEDLRSAVEELPGLLTEVRPGWFTVSRSAPDRR